MNFSKDKLRRYIPFAILALIYVAFIPINFNSHEKIVLTKITDGYYDDLDRDGFQDDIGLIIELELLDFSEEEFIVGVKYSLIIGITTPSGFDFIHKYVDEEYTSKFTIFAELFDHATESGWYEVYAIGVYENLNPNKPIIFSYLKFDPPGGQAGDDPKIRISKIY